MTKSALKTAIDATIGGLVGLVTKARHKSANDVIVDELFSAIYEEDQTTGVKTTLIKSGVIFNITLTKKGNITYVKLFFSSSTDFGTGEGDIDILQINDSELQQKTGKTYYLNSFPFSGDDSHTTVLKIAGGKIILANGFTIHGGLNYGVSDFYLTND